MTNRRAGRFRPLVIRAARRSDIPALQEFFALFAPEVDDPPPPEQSASLETAAFGPKRSCEIRIASEGGKALGYTLFSPRYDPARGQSGYYLCDLFVVEKARRKGVARALMADLATLAIARGVGFLVWDVWRPNRRAYAFYESIGAEHIDDLSIMEIAGNALGQLAQESSGRNSRNTSR